MCSSTCLTAPLARRRLTNPWRSSTACTVLMAGHSGAGYRRRKRSRIFGTPEPGYSRLRRTISVSICGGSRLAIGFSAIGGVFAGHQSRRTPYRSNLSSLDTITRSYLKACAMSMRSKGSR